MTHCLFAYLGLPLKRQFFVVCWSFYFRKRVSVELFLVFWLNLYM